MYFLNVYAPSCFIATSECGVVIFLYAGISSRSSFSIKVTDWVNVKVAGYYHTSTVSTRVAYPDKKKDYNNDGPTLADPAAHPGEDFGWRSADLGRRTNGDEPGIADL